MAPAALNRLAWPECRRSTPLASLERPGSLTWPHLRNSANPSRRSSEGDPAPPWPLEHQHCDGPLRALLQTSTTILRGSTSSTRTRRAPRNLPRRKDDIARGSLARLSVTWSAVRLFEAGVPASLTVPTTTSGTRWHAPIEPWHPSPLRTVGCCSDGALDSPLSRNRFKPMSYRRRPG